MLPPKASLVAAACVFAFVACRDRESSSDSRPAAGSAEERGRAMLRYAARCESSREAAPCLSACDLGHSNSCARAGDAVLATGDRSRAGDLHRRACDGGSGLGCARVGRDHEARFYCRVHCEQGHAASCLELAHIFRDGRGGPAAPDVAFTYRERACRLGLRQACEEL